MPLLFLELEAFSRLSVASYSHGVEMELTRDARRHRQRLTGRPRHGEFKITRWIDRATPYLYKACCDGRVLHTVRLVLEQPNPDYPSTGVSDDVSSELSDDPADTSVTDPEGEDKEEVQTASPSATLPYFSFVLSDVIITSVLTSVEEGVRPLETLHLNYGAIDWCYESHLDPEGPHQEAWRPES